MAIPVIGMVLGLLTAIFITYRKPREYATSPTELTTAEIEAHIAKIKPFHAIASITAIIITFRATIIHQFNYYRRSRRINHL